MAQLLDWVGLRSRAGAVPGLEARAVCWLPTGVAGEDVGDDLVGALARLLQENWLPRQNEVDQTDGWATHHLLGSVCV